uniref:PH domain-containing protein n=1 Tax=Sinocyclocheilus anshuiensis TaxID=1608454 RepID=A0A671MZB6_9TELE
MSNKKKPTMMEELYTGYLLKSPPLTKSWKRRFFVLSKTGDSYRLTYHVNNKRRDKPQGEIDLSKISQLFIGPEAHQKWDWIQKNFKCSLSSVLFLKTIFLNAITRQFHESQHDTEFNLHFYLCIFLWSFLIRQRALEVDQEEADTTCMQKNETHTHVEKEICVSQNDLKNSLILTQAEGKPCVSDCRMVQDSCLFHKGDQILAFNDLLIDTVEEIQMYLRRLGKDEVKLTIRRLIGSQPLHSEPCPT